MMKKSEFFSFRTTPENIEYLKKIAKSDDRSLSWVLSKMVDYFREKGSPDETLDKIRK